MTFFWYYIRRKVYAILQFMQFILFMTASAFFFVFLQKNLQNPKCSSYLCTRNRMRSDEDSLRSLEGLLSNAHHIKHRPQRDINGSGLYNHVRFEENVWHVLRQSMSSKASPVSMVAAT